MRSRFTKKAFRRMLVGLFLTAAIIQLVPVERSNPPVLSDIPASVEVRAVLRRACYDCHSNLTVWPWYSSIAPFSWLVAGDVREGREELNFSTWSDYTQARQVKKLKEILEEVEEGEMPPSLYLLTHPNAALSKDEKELLRAWVLDAKAAKE